MKAPLSGRTSLAKKVLRRVLPTASYDRVAVSGKEWNRRKPRSMFTNGRSVPDVGGVGTF